MRVTRGVVMAILGVALSGACASLAAQCPTGQRAVPAKLIVGTDTIGPTPICLTPIRDTVIEQVTVVVTDTVFVTRVDTVVVQLPGRVDTVTVVRVDTVFVQVPPADTTPPVVPPPPPPPPPPVIPPPPPPPPAAGPRLLADSARIALWRRQRADNTWGWRVIADYCARSQTATQRYEDVGLPCAIVYVTTGDAAAARKAAQLIVSKLPLEPGADANIRREYQIELALIYDWTADAVSAAERQAMERLGDRWAEYALARNTPPNIGGVHTGDSDQLTGTTCGTLLWTIARQRRTPSATDWVALTSNGPHGPLPMGGRSVTSVNRSTALNAIADYVRHAEGGEWIESSEYNPGTLSLLAMCAEGMRTSGLAPIPGLTQFWRDLGTAQALGLSADARSAVQWGDEENPRDLRVIHRMIALAIAHGLGGSGYAGAAFDALRDRGGEPFPRFFLFHDPYRQSVPLPATLAHVAPGIGISHRTDAGVRSFAMTPNRTRVDHSDDEPLDVQVQRNGWLLTRPLGYNGPKHLLGNGVSYAGFTRMDTSGVLWSRTAASWSAIAWETRGPAVPAGYWDPPPAFLTRATRVVVHGMVQGVPFVITRDEVAGWRDPRTLKLDRYYPDVQQRITAESGQWWVRWHTPVQPTISGSRVSWSAPNGTPVRLDLFGATTITPVDERQAFAGYAEYQVRSSERAWHVRATASGGTLFSVWQAGALPVTRNGDTVTIGGVSWTLAPSGVTGP